MITFIVVLLIVKAQCEIPDFIQVCHRDNPKLSNCITNSIEILKPHLKVGIPELDVPPLEPLPLADINVILGSGDSVIRTNLSNIQIWGASDFRIQNLRVDINSNVFQYKVVIPKLYLYGNYEINTQLLFLHIKGKGNIHVNITDYRFDCTMKGHKIQKNNENYLEFEKMNCDLDFKDAKVHLGNLFNGNALLGNVTNNAINDHLDTFFKEIKPNIVLTLEEKFTDTSNKITLRFSYEELFP